jgi:hypothetical protein
MQSIAHTTAFIHWCAADSATIKIDIEGYSLW